MTKWPALACADAEELKGAGASGTPLRPAALAHEKDQRWQRINLHLHLGEVVVEVKHGGHGKQADISADSKDCGLGPYRKYSS
jgi:hypothetical protein